MPAFVLIKGKIANINGKENIYLPAYAIINANITARAIVNDLIPLEIFFEDVLINPVSYTHLTLPTSDLV